MNISKKLIAGILALTLAISVSVPAFAAEINEKSSPKTSDAQITTHIDPSYIVVIPEDTTVAFNALATDFGAVTLKAAQINPGYYVRVDVKSGVLTNTADSAKTISYAITDGTGTAYATAKYYQAGDTTPLKIAIAQDDWNKAYAGDYSDTVTFTVSYTNA